MKHTRYLALFLLATVFNSARCEEDVVVEENNVVVEQENNLDAQQISQKTISVERITADDVDHFYLMMNVAKKDSENYNKDAWGKVVEMKEEFVQLCQKEDVKDDELLEILKRLYETGRDDSLNGMLTLNFTKFDEQRVLESTDEDDCTFVIGVTRDHESYNKEAWNNIFLKSINTVNELDSAKEFDFGIIEELVKDVSGFISAENSIYKKI